MMTHKDTTRRHVLRVLAFLVLTAAVSFAAVAASTGNASHIVVIGEVQGSAATVTRLLTHLGLADAQGHWTGGDTVLVQTGDLMDGGEHVRAVLDLFMRLQEEAPAAGGRVIVLMGNHEAMNILGELRDVNYLAYQSFAGPESEARQRQAFDDYVAWRQGRARAVGSGEFVFGEDFKAEWLATHPVGWIEYVEAMGAGGEYGKWLRTLPVAAQFGEVVFIHAGISPEMKGVDLEAINRRAAEEVAAFDEDRASMAKEELCLPTSSAREMVGVVKEEIDYVNSLDASQRTPGNPRVARLLELQDLTRWGSWSLLTDQGPLWFRGASKWDETARGAEMAEILDTAGCRRMVTGQSDGKEHLIRSRFDDRVLLTSVDLADDLWAGGGEPAALDIDNGVYTVVTLEGREVLIGNPPDGNVQR
jgi:hypothetical protein